MSEEIKEIKILYLSGREEILSDPKAIEVFAQSRNRNDWAAGKSNIVTLFKGVGLGIYRDGKTIIFEDSSGTKKFDGYESLKSEPNKYWLTLYGFNVLDKSLHEL